MQYAFQAFNVAKRLYHYYNIVFNIKRNLLTHEMNIFYDIDQRIQKLTIIPIDLIIEHVGPIK